MTQTRPTKKKKERYNKNVVCAFYRTHGVEAPRFEWQFHHKKKWAFDMAWPEYRVAVEVQGGTFMAASKRQLSAALFPMIQAAHRMPLTKLASMVVDKAYQMMQAGRHAQGPALRKEYEKLNAAQLDEWHVLLIFPEDVLKKETCDLIRTAIRNAKERMETEHAALYQDTP